MEIGPRRPSIRYGASVRAADDRSLWRPDGRSTTTVRFGGDVGQAQFTAAAEGAR